MREVAAGKTAATVKPTAPMLRAKGVRLADDVQRHRRGDPTARGGKGAASRTVGLLGGIFTFAVKAGLRADNPVQGVERYRDRRSQRYLTADELRRLATALAAAGSAGANAHGLAIIRLLVLTGARKSEIEQLRWSEVDFQHSCLRLADGKTGARIVPIGAAAVAVLSGLKRSETAAHVFPSADAPVHRPYLGTPKLWERQVRPAANLGGVRLHDLRHTYASLAAAGGASLPLIGAILGHRDVKTTAQYAHLADDPVKAVAERTAAAADAAMSGVSAEIIPMRRS